MKRKIISLMTAVTMLMSLISAMPLTASAKDYTENMSNTITMYYTDGNAGSSYTYTRTLYDVFNKFNLPFTNNSSASNIISATVDDVSICDITKCYGGSLTIDDTPQKYEIEVTPKKIGTTTVTVCVQNPYRVITIYNKFTVEVKRCPNHSLTLGTSTAVGHKQTCSTCGFSVTKQHTYNENHICTVCDYECKHSFFSQTKNENEHYETCRDCGYERNRGAHTYTANSANQHNCTVCEYSENHTFNENGTCTVCGHSHTYNSTDSKRTCTECGYSENHTYDENHICTVCKHACSHSSETQYKTSTEHYKVCAYCKLKTESEPHTYQQKTGDKTYHYCSVCNYSQSHSFGAYVVVSQPTSTADGVKKRTCSICGYEESITFTKPPHSENNNHNLCNDSSCTDANHKLPTSGLNKSWVGANSDTTLIYSYPIGSDTPSSYYLYNIIKSGTTLTGEWTIPNFVTEKKLYNCLDGTRLTLSDGAYIHIKSGQNYSLTDCREGMGEIYGGTNGVIKIDSGGKFSLFEGTITGNSGSSGIIENSGTTNIYGGTITGNTGTVIKNSGTLNIYGGAITNNTGAAIENSGTVNIYGGTLTNNAGGGIIGTGTINFKEGNPVIESNTANGAICNVKGAETISVTALGEKASIGFTPATAVTAGSPVDISANGGEYYSRFVSDNGDYAIIQSGSKIQLIAAHSVLEHHAAVAATCTEGGVDEYWSCVDCNRLYSDKDGNTEIYAIPTTDATGHSITHHEEVSPTCTEAGNSEYWECTTCHKLFSDENGETEISEIPTIQATGHSLIEHAAQAATCTESGNIAYWECSGCNKLFSDENGTTETTLENTVIAAKGHTEVEIPAVAATCTKGGKTAGVKCSVCGTVLTAPTDTAALGHSWGAWEITKPATEAEDGEKSRTCSRCNETETQVIPAAGHTCDWGDWTITTAPTLTATGKAERVCKTNAAHKENVDLPVLTDTTVWTYEEITAPTQDTDGEGKYTSVYGEVKITLPATGTGDTDKFSIRYEGGNAIVTAPTAGTYAVLFAAYDGGRLTGVTVQSVTVEKGETTVEPQGFTAGGTVKVMLWENLTSMKPLCKADEQVSLAE
ncbi:MAG: hypothetical protein HFE49_04050 [Clostridia bacterium]|nr:hypothetical protein [Clostridia bacterium]